jgi:GNAT superfamily N-acetyltransferase
MNQEKRSRQSRRAPARRLFRPVKLQPITDIEKISNAEIRRCAKDGSKAVVTKHFVAVENREELAFVSLDIFPPTQQPLCLYTLVVPKLLRRKGIGSRVLVEVERLAVEWGYRKVLLRPEPLDEIWSKESLERWYSKRGYAPPDPERPDVWTKTLSGK